MNLKVKTLRVFRVLKTILEYHRHRNDINYVLAINKSGMNYCFYFVFNLIFFKSRIKYSIIKYFN